MGQRWRLSERGLRLITTAHHLKIECIACSEDTDGRPNLVQQGVDVLLRHLEHTVGIYRFFASLTQAASQERLQGHEHRLFWWETGAACERRYRDHEHWHNLRPDAVAEYQAGERHVRFWLEWDRGTMATRDLAIKCRAYGHYVASHEWFKEKGHLPFLLIVTPERDQEMRIARVATDILTGTQGLVIRTTTTTWLSAHGLAAPIWHQVLPHSDGTDLMPHCTFYA